MTGTLSSTLIKQAEIDAVQQAGLVQDLLQIAAMNRHQVNQKWSQSTGLPAAPDDAVGDITLGDRNIYYTSPPPAAPQTIPSIAPQNGSISPAAVQPTAGGIMPALAKLAVPGLLIASGAGAGIGIPMLASAIPQIAQMFAKQPAPAAPMPPPPLPIQLPGKEWDSNVDMIVEPPK